MRLLVGGHHTEWDMKERVYLVLKWLPTHPQSPEGIFLRPHPILSLNLRAHLSQWHLLLSYQAVCRIYFTCNRTWHIVFELRENCKLYFDIMCKWTYQHQVSWYYHGFSLARRSVGKGSCFIRICTTAFSQPNSLRMGTILWLKMSSLLLIKAQPDSVWTVADHWRPLDAAWAGASRHISSLTAVVALPSLRTGGSNDLDWLQPSHSREEAIHCPCL